MQLPPDSHIARSKITDYLLAWQARGDKSRFLQLAGYDSSMADELIHDMRAQILIHEAVAAEVTEHGQYYEITCPLAGPNGRILDTRTIWMREHLSGQIKFITLIPSQKRENDH